MSKFPDGLNLDTLIIKMWINCLVGSEDKEEYGVPEKLNDDISNLDHQMQKTEFLHYVTAIRETSMMV